MSHRRRVRTVQVPDELLNHIKSVLQRQGVVRATRALGVSRTALLGAIATGKAMAGTIAILREKTNGKLTNEPSQR